MKIKKLFREVNYPIYLYDENGNEIYCEDSNGFWEKCEYDSNGNEIYFENSDGDIQDIRPKTELTYHTLSSSIYGPNCREI